MLPRLTNFCGTIMLELGLSSTSLSDKSSGLKNLIKRLNKYII